MPEYCNNIIETLLKKADEAADRKKELNDTEEYPQGWFYESGYEDALREAIDIIGEAAKEALKD